MALSQVLIKKIHFYLAYRPLNKGQSLVEILLVVALMALILPALLTALIASRNGKPQQAQRIQEVALLKETQEAVRNIREAGWQSFAGYTSGTVYHPVISGSSWILQTGSETINGLTRQIVLSDVYRDPNTGAIVSSGGALDPSTRKITVTVSWTQPYSSSITAVSYLTRYADNLTWVQTTQADFQAGTLAGTSVTAKIPTGGEVVLAAGNANWCIPHDYVLSTYTLPRNGNAITASPGPTQGSPSSAYVGMGDGTNGPTLLKLSISDPPAPTPPVVSSVGSGYTSSYKTNGVFNDGTYSYLAVAGSSSQVVILDSSYNKISSINLSSGKDANGIFVASQILYVTSGSKIYTYNVSNPATPVALTSASVWDSNATALQVVVQSAKAYVSMSGSITGLEIFTVSLGGALLSPWSVASVNWFQTPAGLAVNSSGTRAYIAFSANGSIQGGFFIVDTGTRWFGFFNPNIATYNTNWDGNGTTNPLGMAIATANKAIIVGTGGSEQYQVVDVTNDNPTHCGGLSIAQGVSGVTSIIQQDGRVFAYAISGEAQNQFKIVEGGTGGQYTNSGTFESSIFDAQSQGLTQTAFNYFTATVSQPGPTTIQLQVAAAPPVSGTCTAATYQYVGPGGSTTQFFTVSSGKISSAIPYGTYGSYQNPARCFRYKAFLSTTDTNQTPILYDMTVNYSP